MKTQKVKAQNYKQTKFNFESYYVQDIKQRFCNVIN